MDPWFIPFYGIVEHDTIIAGNDQVEEVGDLAKTEDRSLATQVFIRSINAQLWGIDKRSLIFTEDGRVSLRFFPGPDSYMHSLGC